jgi:hypothetical protein
MEDIRPNRPEAFLRQLFDQVAFPGTTEAYPIVKTKKSEN